ncbi:hypothetical protein KORDIASMS9_03864 [Kordia sp. SMS9]|uniref:hypothetical protein n=1 Tax=Kordia sp. SMS9 TaxID=2282170 RepID=UPI000E0D7179|nr:hypothetical protein [Kordia sp. SMS9]AXG71607.1 hypothetical protein KORDIASMS9_03864 [Kordia sp. SMS9]
MYKRKKTQKRIEELKTQIQELEQIVNSSTKTESKISKREFFISILGIIIAVVTTIIAFQQIKISEKQNDLVVSQLDITRKQGEFQELEIYKSFLELDQNNQSEVTSFINYIDLLDSKTTDTLLYKFSRLDCSNLSFFALKKYHERLFLKNNKIKGNDLADLVIELDEKISDNKYCESFFIESFNETLNLVLEIKNKLSFEEYKVYLKIIKNDFPLNLISIIAEFEMKTNMIPLYELIGDNLVLDFLDGYTYLKIFTIPTSLYDEIFENNSNSTIHDSIHLSMLHRELVQSSIISETIIGNSVKIELINMNYFNSFFKSFEKMLHLYFETFYASKSIKALKSNLKVTNQIIQENNDWRCRNIVITQEYSVDTISLKKDD